MLNFTIYYQPGVEKGIWDEEEITQIMSKRLSVRGSLSEVIKH